MQKGVYTKEHIRHQKSYTNGINHQLGFFLLGNLPIPIQRWCFLYMVGEIRARLTPRLSTYVDHLLQNDHKGYFTRLLQGDHKPVCHPEVILLLINDRKGGSSFLNQTNVHANICSTRRSKEGGVLSHRMILEVLGKSLKNQRVQAVF